MPTPSRDLQEIVEFRGVEGLVAAPVLTDTASSFTTGDVFAIAGVAEIAKTTSSSNEAHYYDNIPAVVVSGNGADEVSVNVSALPSDVLAYITGQYYDPTTGMLAEGDATPPYLALGYITKKTNGDLMYVWRLKGKFTIPAQTNSTENAGTDANGQTLTYMGISTTHKFSKSGKTAKAIDVDVAKGLADVSTFFDAVTTPDTLLPKSGAYTLTISAAEGTTVTVTRNGIALATDATIFAGDILVISATGGTVRVNGTAFTSGDAMTVHGNISVAAEASA